MCYSEISVSVTCEIILHIEVTNVENKIVCTGKKNKVVSFLRSDYWMLALDSVFIGIYQKLLWTVMVL